MVVAKKICRICASDDQDLKYIDDAELLEKLRLCANITINYEDSLPKHICQSCEHGLEYSYRLRKQGEETERRLLLALQISENEPYENVECLEEYVTDSSTVADVITCHEEGGSDNVVQSDAISEEYEFNEQLNCGIDYDCNDCYYVNDTSAGEAEDMRLDDLVEFDKAAVLEAPIDVKEIEPEPKTIFTCGTCLLVFQCQSDYRRHVKTHGDKRFQCTQCDKWFAKRFLLRRHERCHRADVETYACEQCSQVFRDPWNLLRHKRSVHEGRVFLCAVCSQTFGRADVLKNHMVRHSDEKQFTCNKCGASFKSQRNLGLHMKTHEEKQEGRSEAQLQSPTIINPRKTFTCPTCGKISKYHFVHVNHLRTHTEERPYACDMCPKKFRTMAAKTTHKMIHTDQRPYQCEICFNSFRQRSHLKDHQLTHSDTMSFECGVCGMAFKKRGNMKTHMRTHKDAVAAVAAPTATATLAATAIATQLSTTVPGQAAPVDNSLAVEGAEERVMGEFLHHVDIGGTENSDLFLTLESEEKFNSFYTIDDIIVS